ncbi:Holliday junction resolvase RuvX [Corynebacterium sp. CCM 9203]|uniref:Holliday junction resolvase RuvX n=1 Tax=Corynebacterium sp. CCM 9203 TaxID=3057615 RepID=UPI003525CF41
MSIQPDKPGRNDPGRGRRLGIDVGTVRIGVAVSDSNSVLATPVETIPRVTGLRDRDGSDIDRILELIREYGVVEVIVGLPRDLRGNGSASVTHARELAFRINRRLTGWDDQGRAIPVRMADERLTSVLATRALHMSGRNTKNGRSVIDQAAAVEILQSWLDARINALAATYDEDGS